MRLERLFQCRSMTPLNRLTNKIKLMTKYETKNENNRGKIQIIADIIDLCTSSIRKTHIMYKGNLSYEQINRYLAELLIKNLIEQNIEEGVAVYRTTEKGRSYLYYYNLMMGILDENLPKSNEIIIMQK
jgi:predicted transcriptional regulator